MISPYQLGLRTLRSSAQHNPHAPHHIVSPLSLLFALGALSETLGTGRELNRLLELLHCHTTTEVREKLDTLASALTPHKGVHYATHLAIKASVPTYPECLEQLSRYPRTDAKSYDATNYQELNAWVSKNTGGLITSAGVDFNETDLAILSALYFKAAWRHNFEYSASRYRPFYSQGQTHQVPMMASHNDLRYLDFEGWEAVRLPYRGRGLSAAFLLPPTGTSPWEITPEHLHQALSKLRRTPYRDMEVVIPKLDVELDIELPISSLGLDLRNCFQRLSPQPLELGKAGQKVRLKVDEEGTEGAALTYFFINIIGAPQDPPPPPPVLVFNRPYLMVIYEDSTLVPIFLSAIELPTGGRIKKEKAPDVPEGTPVQVDCGPTELEGYYTDYEEWLRDHP